MDETGWREDKKRAWLWVAVTALTTVFVIRSSRGSKVAKEVPGEGFSSVLVTDRWSGYTWVDATQRQLCWAHLIRDFQKIAERGGESEDVGTALREKANEVFHLWHRFQRDEMSRDVLVEQMTPLRDGIKVLLEAGKESSHPKTRGTCDEILKLEPALWTFVRLDGVEPTNNISERSIRPAVIWRKTSFGTDAARGSRYVERVLTVGATCRQQGRDVIEYLRSAILASRSGRLAPSLVSAIPTGLPAVA